MRYIDADKLKSEFDYKHIDMNKTAAVVHHKNILEIINQQPTADVRENVRGEWIFDGQRHRGGIEWCHCSVCGNEENADYAIVQGVNFCPNCGADMRGGQHEKDN